MPRRRHPHLAVLAGLLLVSFAITNAHAEGGPPAPDANAPGAAEKPASAQADKGEKLGGVQRAPAEEGDGAAKPQQERGQADGPAPRRPAVTRGEPAPPEGRRPGDAQGDAEPRISMTFEKAEITSVLRMLGRVAKTTIVISPDLTGEVSITATGQITLKEAFEIMKAALNVRGFTFEGGLGDKVIKVVPLKSAITRGVQVFYDVRAEDLPEGDDVITLVLPIQNSDAAKLKTDLQSLVAKNDASLASSASTNMVIITDAAQNVRRLAAIIEYLDKTVEDVLEVKVIPLEYAYAPEIADTLEDLFEEPQQQFPFRGGPPQRGPDGRPVPRVPREQGLADLKGRVKFGSDERTNSVIVTASAERIAKVEEIIEQLDIKTTADIIYRVFKLENSDANTVAQELGQLFEQPQGTGRESYSRFSFSSYYSRSRSRGGETKIPGSATLRENLIVPDARTNSVIVTASADNMQAYEDMIEMLDAAEPVTDIVKIYPLENARAEDIEGTLGRVFRQQQRFPGFFTFLFGSSAGQSGGPLDILRDVGFEGDEKTNSLVVTGPPQVFPLVDKLVQELDRREVQVFIEVVIIDVTLNEDTRLGIEWTWSNTGAKHTVGTELGVAAGATTSPVGMAYTVLGKHLTSFLQGLSTKNDVKVLSTPHIATTNNVQGTITVGQRFPFVKEIVTTAAGQVIPSFDFENINVTLQVTPHIHNSDFVQLDIEQTVDELVNTVVQGGFTQPVIGTRNAETTLSVKDGDTIVIGGIMRERTNTIENKVPVLGDIPLLGKLFRRTQEVTDSNELLVFLTPHIIRGDEEARIYSEFKRNQLSSDVKVPSSKIEGLPLPGSGENAATTQTIPVTPATPDPKQP